MPFRECLLWILLTGLDGRPLEHSRDGGLPDRGLFGRINKRTKTPVYAVWLVILLSVLMGVLDWASLIAVQAIFSMVCHARDAHNHD